MSEPQLCPQCGSEIPAGSPAGLCPKCLVLAGLESQKPSDPRFEPTLASPPPKSSPEAALFSVEDLAARFPQLEILELLGRGGIGAVYKARQKHLDRLVAVKILPPEVSGDPAFSERFTREARALARLNHPNIVGVYDFGTALPSPSGRGAGGESGEAGLFYFIMEFVDGVNLRQAIQSGHMDPKQALAIVPQICDALQFAHDEGIVHRDIKPENILIDKRGRVKIADFGLAKLLGQETADHGLTATQQVMGTLRYMAPEQMEGSKTVDHRADIYSLGVVFYELLTGELPIGRFAPPSKKVEIDVRLDEVVLRALEKEPEKRYQHASEVKTEVEQIRSGPAAASKGSVAAGARLAPLAIAGLVVGLVVPLFSAFLTIPLAQHASERDRAMTTTVLPITAVCWIATSVLGAIAFTQIRRSDGKLYGLRMSLLEAMVIPAVVVYCAVVGAALCDCLGLLLLSERHQARLGAAGFHRGPYSACCRSPRMPAFVEQAPGAADDAGRGPRPSQATNPVGRGLGASRYGNGGMVRVVPAPNISAGNAPRRSVGGQWRRIRTHWSPGLDDVRS